MQFSLRRSMLGSCVYGHTIESHSAHIFLPLEISNEVQKLFFIFIL